MAMFYTPNCYDSDLCWSQWQKIKKFFPKPSDKGRKRVWGDQTILNAIFYLIRSGCQWRMLPNDFPPWQTVYGYFHQWMVSGLIEKIHKALFKKLRKLRGRKENPTMAIVDSQSVKTTEVGGEKGFDGGKLIKGRKRHIIVDVNGFLIGVLVHAANVEERSGARQLLESLNGADLESVEKILADAGYDGQPMVKWVAENYNMVWEAVKRTEKRKDFMFLSGDGLLSGHSLG